MRGPVALSREPIWVLNCNREKKGGERGEEGGLPIGPGCCACVYRSATIALSAVLSHQNIKGGARSRRCIDFPLPFLSPVSSFFFILHPSPSPRLHCGDVFLHAAREREGGEKGVPPSIDRASLFQRSISNPPFLPLSRVLPRGSTFDQAAAWISLMNLKSDRQGGFWNNDEIN